MSPWTARLDPNRSPAAASLAYKVLLEAQVPELRLNAMTAPVSAFVMIASSYLFQPTSSVPLLLMINHGEMEHQKRKEAMRTYDLLKARHATI
eukprot:scaffold317918_cov39-Prasinocladus_malaysianus.AAC.1